MQANLETLGSLQRTLNITVPMADIDVEVQSRLKRLTRTVRIDGFRPGKVPLTVVVKQFGPQVRQEVLGDTLQKTLAMPLHNRTCALPAIRSLMLRRQLMAPTSSAIARLSRFTRKWLWATWPRRV